MIPLAFSALRSGLTHFMLIMIDSDSSKVEFLPLLFPQGRCARRGQDSQACLGPGLDPGLVRVMTQGLGAPLMRWEHQLPQKGLAGWYTGRSAWEVRRDQE